MLLVRASDQTGFGEVTPEDAGQLFDAITKDGSLEAICPGIGNRARALKDCGSCRFCEALVLLSDNPTDWARHARIGCRVPIARPIVPVPGQRVPDAIRLAINGRQLSRLEREVFVDQAHTCFCPWARRVTKALGVIAPPCPTCQDYRGLKRRKKALVFKGPVTLFCAPRRHVLIRRRVPGSVLVKVG